MDSQVQKTADALMDDGIQAADVRGSTHTGYTVPEHIRPIRDKVLKFVEEKVYPHERAYFNGDPEWKDTLNRLSGEAREMGLFNLGHPKHIGGRGMPWSDYAYINEVIGRSDAAMNVFGSYTLQTCMLLDAAGTQEQKDKVLYPMANGDLFVSFSVTEPGSASSDPTNIQTTAHLEGDEWVINGSKWYTTGADKAEYIVVMCRTEPEGTPKHDAFSMILVPNGVPGMTKVRDMHVMGFRHNSHPEHRYENARVPAANLLGKRGDGFKLFQLRLGPARMFACQRWLGQLQRAFDIMCRRMNDRKLADGQRLADKQMMRQYVYDSYLEIQAARTAVFDASAKLERGEQARVEVGLAKTLVARNLNKIIDRAIQVHGAVGLCDDTPLEAMYRMARIMRIADGPDEVHIDRVGKIVLREFENGQGWDFGLR